MAYERWSFCFQASLATDSSQCTSSGSYDIATCQAVTAKPPPKNCDGINCDVTTGAVTRPVYRISVRITGPRGNQTYTQTTVAL